jgi:hypothetical protein
VSERDVLVIPPWLFWRQVEVERLREAIANRTALGLDDFNDVLGNGPPVFADDFDEERRG